MMLFSLLLIALAAGGAGNGSEKTAALTDQDELAIRRLQVQIGREAEVIARHEAEIKGARERQVKLAGDLQRVAAEIGKRLGCTVQEAPDTGLVCVKAPEKSEAKDLPSGLQRK